MYRRILRKLDETSLLGFKIWEFSFNSLPRGYGLIFIWEIVLKHFLRTLRGLIGYRRFSKRRKDRGEIVSLFEEDEEDFVRGMVGEESLLVAVGFCQKPMRTSGCPSGRFNHDCLYLSNLDLNSSSDDSLNPTCQGCQVRAIGTRALEIGAGMYIMTSARDIARDMFISSINCGKFKRVILFLCPYSAEAIIFPLMICGMRGFLIKYSSGDCSDYSQFLSADRGIKDKQTSLSRGTFDEALSLLDRLVAENKGCGRSFRRFEREGNIYTSVSHGQQAYPSS